ncbi:MAG: tol-pal system protein YbgF [Pseudomonadota bacterium]
MLRPTLCLFALFTAFVAPATAQMVDPRVPALEEQVRRLTGQVEELNFQLLQMQENLRRAQEDMEFRIQLLEEQQQGSLAPSATPETDVATPPQLAEKSDRLDNVGSQIAADLNRIPAQRYPSKVAPGADDLGPRNLGTLSVDADGNVIGAELDFTPASVASAIDGDVVASVTLTGTPEDIYSEGYSHVLNGDYGQAEAVFSSFVATYPSDPLAADAKFWLGESLLAQGRFEDAAETFIDLRTEHPSAGKAPETFFKIGKIMNALGNRDVACATFEEAVARFDGMSARTRQMIDGEQQRARC